MTEEIERLARLIIESRKVVVFTGAGRRNLEQV